MSEDQTKQTVVDEPKAPAEPGAADTSARTDGDDLDKLLATYDDESKPKPPPEPAKPEQTGTDTTRQPGPDPAIAEVQRYIFRQDMDKTIKSVRGDLDAELFDDALVESWIDAQARQDPRLAKAWANRSVNPQQFEKVVGTLSRNFAKKYGKLPDKAATEDREAVTAAVRGASTKAPPEKPPDFSKMSPAEFQAEKDRLFGG